MTMSETSLSLRPSSLTAWRISSSLPGRPASTTVIVSPSRIVGPPTISGRWYTDSLIFSTGASSQNARRSPPPAVLRLDDDQLFLGRRQELVSVRGDVREVLGVVALAFVVETDHRLDIHDHSRLERRGVVRFEDRGLVQADPQSVADVRHEERQVLGGELPLDGTEDVARRSAGLDHCEARLLDGMQRGHDLALPRAGRADDSDPHEIRVDHLEEARAEIDAPDRSLFERKIRSLDVRAERTAAGAEDHEDVDSAPSRHVSRDIGCDGELADSGLRSSRRVENGLERRLRRTSELLQLVRRLDRLDLLDLLVERYQFDVRECLAQVEVRLGMQATRLDANASSHQPALLQQIGERERRQDGELDVLVHVFDVRLRCRHARLAVAEKECGRPVCEENAELESLRERNLGDDVRPRKVRDSLIRRHHRGVETSLLQDSEEP